MAGDTIRLVVPTDGRYLDVALTTIEVLADRSGLDRAEVAALRTGVLDVLRERLAHCRGEAVGLRYEVGDGFLGVTVDGETS